MKNSKSKSKDVSSPAGSSSSTITFVSGSDLNRSSKRYSVSTNGDNAEAETPSRNVMKVVAKSLGHSVHDHGGQRKRMPAEKNVVEEKKGNTTNFSIPSSSAVAKSVSLCASHCPLQDPPLHSEKEEEEDLSSHSYRAPDGGPLSFSFYCSPASRVALNQDRYVPHQNSEGRVQKGILKKPVIHTDPVSASSDALPVGTGPSGGGNNNLNKGGTLGHRNSNTGGGGSGVGAAQPFRRFSIFSNPYGADEGSVYVSKNRAPLRHRGNVGETGRGRVFTATPPDGVTAAMPTLSFLLASSGNLRPPRTDNSEEPRPLLTNPSNDAKPMEVEEEGERVGWNERGMMLCMKCSDILFSLWSDRISPCYELIRQNVLWTVGFVFCIVVLVSAGAMTYRNISFVKYAERGQVRKNSQGIQVASHFTRKMLELQKARDFFSEFLQEPFQYLPEHSRDTTPPVTPPTAPKKKSFFSFSSSSFASSSATTSSNNNTNAKVFSTPPVPVNGSVLEEKYLNTLAQRQLYNEIQSELQQVDAARQESITFLHRSSGYKGPREDLEFLISQHVKYELLVKELAAKELMWVGTVRDETHLRLHRCPVVENYAMSVPQKRVSGKTGQPSQEENWKKKIMLIPFSWFFSPSQRPNSDAVFHENGWSGLSSPISSKRHPTNHTVRWKSKIPAMARKYYDRKKTSSSEGGPPKGGGGWHHTQSSSFTPPVTGGNTSLTVHQDSTRHEGITPEMKGIDSKMGGEKDKINDKADAHKRSSTPPFESSPLHPQQQKSASLSEMTEEEDLPRASSASFPLREREVRAEAWREGESRIPSTSYASFRSSVGDFFGSAPRWHPHALAYSEEITVVTHSSPSYKWWWWPSQKRGQGGGRSTSSSKDGIGWLRNGCGGYGRGAASRSGRKSIRFSTRQKWVPLIIFLILGILFVFL